jgi:hypothetical protein
VLGNTTLGWSRSTDAAGIACPGASSAIPCRTAIASRAGPARGTYDSDRYGSSRHSRAYAMAASGGKARPTGTRGRLTVLIYDPDVLRRGRVMLVFALLFAALAVVGALVGLGQLGHPIYAQSLQSYGWGLAVNAVALAVFFVLIRRGRLRH